MDKEILQKLCELLNEKYIPAKLYEEDGVVLSMLLETIIPGEDVYADIYFANDGKDIEGNYFCSIDFTVKDLSEVDKDDISKIMLNISIVNSTLICGGYSIEADGETMDVGSLYFGEVIPIAKEISKDKVLNLIYSNLEALAGTLKMSVNDVLTVNK